MVLFLTKIQREEQIKIHGENKVVLDCVLKVNVSNRAQVNFLSLYENKAGILMKIDIDFLLKNVKPIVQSVLKRCFTGIPNYPINLDKIADSYNLPIYEKPLKRELAGCFIAKNGESAIVINESDPVVRKRFTTAHELGHFISYKLQDKQQSIIYDERGALATMGTDPEEIFANQFAAELLMPETVFIEQRKINEDKSHEIKINAIKDYFHVSRQAIEIRDKTLYDRRQ